MDNYAWGASAVFALNVAMPLLTLGAALWLLKTSKKAGVFLLIFGVLYFAGSPWLVFCALTALLLWSSASAAKEIFQTFLKAP
jgi:hypothetical protein